MATFLICILQYNKRKDGKYPVSIRVTHNRQPAYINTGYYVEKSKLSRNFELRDNLILPELLHRIENYEKKLVKLGISADKMTARQLADFVSAKSEMDFTDFFRGYIDGMKLSKKTIGLYNVCFNLLQKFRETVYLSDIDNAFLVSFLDYLRLSGVGKRGQQYYLVLLKAVFKAAVKKHRKTTGEFTEDAFEEFTIPEPPQPKKRNIPAEKIRALANFECGDKRMGFARDVFMISFLLCGTNTIDLFGMEKPKDGRLSYNRSKTAGKRKDNAFISYRIEPELLPMLEKYAGTEKAFNFSERYANSLNFNAKINDWLKLFVSELDLPADFSTYYARHSWATIARNKCGISKDDISLSLNHSTGRVVTDDYIEVDFSLIDMANRGVIDFVLK